METNKDTFQRRNPVTRKQYNKVSMRCLDDTSIIRLLIATVRDSYEKDLPNELRPTEDDAASVVAELLHRLELGRAAREVVGDDRAHARRQATQDSYT